MPIDRFRRAVDPFSGSNVGPQGPAGPTGPTGPTGATGPTFVRTARTVTANSTLLNTDTLVVVNSAGATTQTLPTPAAGIDLVVKNTGAGVCTVASSSNIDGQASIDIPQNGSLALFSTATTWVIL